MSSGVTPETLEATLREKLGAVHVEIADLSGESGGSDKIMQKCKEGTTWLTILDDRWLWPDVRGDHCVATIREEDHVG